MSIRKPHRMMQFDVAADINVTPMIDVMLVLLIIFMVITPAIVGATNLPRARTAGYEPEKHPTLEIDARGRISLDVGRHTERVDAAALPGRLAGLYRSRPGDHVLYLKADRNLEYTRVLAAIEAARTAGVTRLAAITEPPRRAERR